MNWTQEQYADLSKKVARKFGKPNFDCKSFGAWITIMELCVEHGIDCKHSRHCREYCTATGNEYTTKYEGHNNDKSLTERVARCLALLEV